MFALITIGLLAGVVTSISPCVLPVLPVILSASTGSRLRPYGVVAGLVISFSASTLLGSELLSALGLPSDLLRWAGIAVLVVIGASLMIPRLGELIERPFARLQGRAPRLTGNGLVLGLGLGLVFVPCAGPVLATIAVVGATHEVGFGAVVLTVAFGVGVGIPLLALALAGDALSRRTAALRARAKNLRIVSGVVLLAVAAAIGFNVTDGLQRSVPGYTSALQRSFENNHDLRGLVPAEGKAPKVGTGDNTSAGDTTCRSDAEIAVDCGPAPEFTGIKAWLNTAGGKSLSLKALRGQVVLIDFWTYSCINCQRTLPHLEAWYSAYHRDGFEIVGVHTPEFAFEHEVGNVRDQAAALGVRYPIAIDNDYATWNAYANQYWPAEYLVDAEGNIRHVSFGEGGYPTTEKLIRELLGEVNQATLPTRTQLPDATPSAEQTPETYLGFKYPQRTSGAKPSATHTGLYAFPSKVAADTYALSGEWRAGPESVTAGAAAQLKLNFRAGKVFLVLGGTGRVQVDVDGRAARTIRVSGVPRLYTLVDSPKNARALLQLAVSPGVEAYDFTFG